MVRVDFQRLLAHHEAGHGDVVESLSLHNAFHVSSPAEFASDQAARSVDNTARYQELLDFFTKNVLHVLGQTVEISSPALNF